MGEVQYARPDDAISNVVPLRRQDDPLTPDECRRLRALLESSERLAHSCPMARRILHPD